MQSGGIGWAEMQGQGHARSGSNAGRRPQNAKAAAQRLAQVMAYQQADDDDEEDELYEYNPVVVAPSTAAIGLGGRPNRTRTPLVNIYFKKLAHAPLVFLIKLPKISK